MIIDHRGFGPNEMGIVRNVDAEAINELYHNNSIRNKKSKAFKMPSQYLNIVSIILILSNE